VAVGSRLIAKGRKSRVPATPEAAAWGVRYKVVETSTVTDESLEQILNDHVAKGWSYDGMQFAMRESSKRPAMAFVLFTRRHAIEPELPARSTAGGDDGSL